MRISCKRASVNLATSTKRPSDSEVVKVISRCFDSRSSLVCASCSASRRVTSTASDNGRIAR
ncbi:Uncharacterised protein [Vibrio cholerae]|nr:Uncharacterised protein [Vibrio cholerae]CSI38018.1 Uncharacterised protein [Vibrio cholerae]